MLLEAQAKREYHSHLENEKQRILERKQQQNEEQAALLQRTALAKQGLRKVFEEKSAAQRELRDQVDVRRRENERLRIQISEATQGRVALAARLKGEIRAVGEAQSVLVDEMQAASEKEQVLQSELHQERVASRRPTAEALSSFSVDSAASSEASTSSRILESADMAYLERKLEEKLRAEQKSWARQRIAGKERLVSLRERCWRQCEAINALTEELAVEEADLEALEDSRQLQESLRRVLPKSAAQCQGADASDGFLVVHQPQSSGAGAPALATPEGLQSCEDACREAVDEAAEARAELEVHRVELTNLQAQLLAEEAALESDGHSLEEAEDAVESLRAEVSSEQLQAERAEQAAYQQRRAMQSEVLQRKEQLRRIREENLFLSRHLDEAAPAGCFGRRGRGTATAAHQPAAALRQQRTGASAPPGPSRAPRR